MAIRIDERGRGHVEPRIVRGPAVAIGLVVVIAILALVSWSIHESNRQERRARAAAEDAAAAAP